jgi:hypothetical protein
MSEVVAIKMPNAAAQFLKINGLFTQAFILAFFYAMAGSFIKPSLVTKCESRK